MNDASDIILGMLTVLFLLPAIGVVLLVIKAIIKEIRK